MNENNKIRWFLKQINILINDAVINNQSAKKLEDYYKDRLIDIKKKTGDNFIKVLKFCLLLLAALSIVGGIALVLINFNWQLLSKYFKTILSFLILLIPQGICAYILVKKKENIILKEVFSLVLSIMFGLSIAFIAQIYQISSSEEMFIFTWAVSTLVILYIFNSVTSLAFYLLLIISLASLMQIKGTIGLVFYPMFIALIPFYIIEYRKKITARIKTIDYFMIISLVISLGITLEKNVPGLWIISYSSLFAVFYLFGISFESGDGIYFSSFKRLVLSPYKITGSVGTAVISYMLVYKYFWEEIGWEFFRKEMRFNQIASLFDYSAAVLLPLIVIVLIFFAVKKKKAFNYILVSFIFAVIVLYLLNSFLIKKAADFPEICSLAAAVFIIIFSSYSFYTGYKNRSKLIVFLNMIFLYIAVFTYFWQTMHDEEFNILMNLVFHIYFGVMLYMSGVLIFNDVEKNKNKLSYFFKVIGIAGIAVITYTMTFEYMWDIVIYRINFFESKFSVFTFTINIIIFIQYLTLLLLLIKDKKTFNYLIAVLGFIFHLAILFSLYYRFLYHIKEISSLIMIGYIFILSVYSFWYGYRNRSSLTILLSSIFLFILIITRFFYSEISVIINGLILIAIGVLLVFINIYFINKIKKG